MAKPTFILVPGAWHTPAHWGPLVESLNSHGYKAVILALPSAVDPNVPGTKLPADQESDIAVVRNAIKEELDQGSDVVVVSHSYGGMPTISALIYLGPAARAQAGHRNSVVAIAGISTFILPEGMPVHQNQSKGGGISEVRGNFICAKESPGPVEAFYHNLPEAEGQRWAALLKSATYLAALMQPNDRANPVEVQRLVVDRIQQNEKAQLHVTELHCSHSPFLSKVEETSAFLRTAAGERIPE